MRLRIWRVWERDFAAVAKEQRDDIRVRVEAGAFLRHVVGDDHVRALARELGARIFGDVVGLRGKAHQDAVALRRAQLGENVGRGLEFEGEALVACA